MSKVSVRQDRNAFFIDYNNDALKTDNTTDADGLYKIVGVVDHGYMDSGYYTTMGNIFDGDWTLMIEGLDGTLYNIWVGGGWAQEAIGQYDGIDAADRYASPWTNQMEYEYEDGEEEQELQYFAEMEQDCMLDELFYQLKDMVVQFRDGELSVVDDGKLFKRATRLVEVLEKSSTDLFNMGIRDGFNSITQKEVGYDYSTTAACVSDYAGIGRGFIKYDEQHQTMTDEQERNHGASQVFMLSSDGYDYGRKEPLYKLNRWLYEKMLAYYSSPDFKFMGWQEAQKLFSDAIKTKEETL